MSAPFKSRFWIQETKSKMWMIDFCSISRAVLKWSLEKDFAMITFGNYVPPRKVWQSNPLFPRPEKCVNAIMSAAGVKFTLLPSDWLRLGENDIKRQIIRPWWMDSVIGEEPRTITISTVHSTSACVTDIDDVHAYTQSHERVAPLCLVWHTSSCCYCCCLVFVLLSLKHTCQTNQSCSCHGIILPSNYACAHENGKWRWGDPTQRTKGMSAGSTLSIE